MTPNGWKMRARPKNVFKSPSPAIQHSAFPMHPKAQALLRQRALASLMNQTKWTELAQALDSVGDNGPLVSIKYLDRGAVDGPSHIHWQEFLQQGCEWCEWMDIHSHEAVHRGQLLAPGMRDHSQAIDAALRRVGAAFSMEDHGRDTQRFRVWGYVDGRHPPDLAR